MQRSPVALYTHSREFREYFRGFYVIVFIGILAQNLKYFDEFDFVNLFLSHRPLPLYLSILINYIIPYFYTNVKNRLYHLCDTLVSDLFFPCFIPLYQGSSPVGRCLSSDRLQVWNYAFLGIKKDRATGSPLLGLVICYEIAQKGAKMPLKMQKWWSIRKDL